MIRAITLATLLSTVLWAQDEKLASYPEFDYQVARRHEAGPHRHTIHLEGIPHGWHQLHLTLTVSITGEVVDAEASGQPADLKFWPKVQPEVRQWKFIPFEENGKAVTAEVDEYVNLVPPERLPTKLVARPVVRPDSQVTIALQRTGCFGPCPSYTVTVSMGGIVFEGESDVVASGKHTDTVSADQVRDLAGGFVGADFYSMDESYVATVTDNPTFKLSITIDGRKKEVTDYVGAWEGMPAVITELENAVDTLARTQRWISGNEGLVQALRAEKFDFTTFDAQAMLKEAARNGKTETVRELLEAGVPLKPLPPTKPEKRRRFRAETQGWLTATGRNPDALAVLIEAGASKDDQDDKDRALASATGTGNVATVRALIAYGANPLANGGRVLSEAAASGSPDMVREILRYHPVAEMRDSRGATAVFAVGASRSTDKQGARVECLRLLVQAGANVNARDNAGNTPLHKIFLTDVEEELLKLGADVNARNNDGETPIFTNVDDDSIPLFIAHGADLTIRNNKGQTAAEAAWFPKRKELLRKAIQEMKQP